MTFNDSRILVTGGTGSFGNEFVKTILAQNPKTVKVFSRDEFKQYNMARKYPDVEYVIGDVRDRYAVSQVVRDVDIIVHAAALKQVPMCERQPMEAIKTNILGTFNLLSASIGRVEKFVALSTDKAVNPINAYGATKSLLEKLVIANGTLSDKTKYCCVRYGNVVGSRGSIVPLFKEQAKTGTITITDPEMTRFWITLQEGVNLVLWCLDNMKQGYIYVPKLKSSKVVDVAKAISPSAILNTIGIRPGEKLHESLIGVDEGRRAVLIDNKVYGIRPERSLYPNIDVDGLLSMHETVVEDGFWYGSNHNCEQLTIPEIQERINGLEE